MTIGKRIKELRKLAGLTQVQLAKKIGATQNILTNYETDRRRPSVDKLPVIANALGASVSDLYNEDTSVKEIPKRKAANSREGKMLESFNTLSPVQQRAILQQTQALASQKEKT